MLIEKLKTDWTESGREVAPWLWDKVKYAWTDATAEFSLLMQNSISSEHNKIQHYVYIALLNVAASGMQIVYLFMLILSVVGVLSIASKQIENDGAMLVSLYVFGFSLLMLIIECQPRYKANIISFISVIAAVGLYEMLKMVKCKVENMKTATELRKQNDTVRC